jgi:hypothetical protein
LSSLKEIIYSLLNEVKSILREYLRETEAALKKRVQRLLISGIAVSVLVALVILLTGSAALFLLIGSLKFLSTFMPVWMAWAIMGLTSAVIAALFFGVLFIFIRKQLKSPTTKQTSTKEQSSTKMQTGGASIDEIKSSMDKETDEIAQKIASLIGKNDAKDLEGSSEIKKILRFTDTDRARKLLANLDKVSNQDEQNMGKVAIVKELLLSTWKQRLYFVVRAAVMGILSAILTFGCILVFGAIDFTLGIILSIGSFGFALVVSRLFDDQIVNLTTRIITFLGGHRSLRNLVINHL